MSGNVVIWRADDCEDESNEASGGQDDGAHGRTFLRESPGGESLSTAAIDEFSVFDGGDEESGMKQFGNQKGLNSASRLESNSENSADGDEITFEQQLAAINRDSENRLQAALDRLESQLFDPRPLAETDQEQDEDDRKQRWQSGGEPELELDHMAFVRDSVPYSMTTPASSEEWAVVYDYLRATGTKLDTRNKLLTGADHNLDSKNAQEELAKANPAAVLLKEKLQLTRQAIKDALVDTLLNRIRSAQQP